MCSSQSKFCQQSNLMTDSEIEFGKQCFIIPNIAGGSFGESQRRMGSKTFINLNIPQILPYEFIVIPQRFGGVSIGDRGFAKMEGGSNNFKMRFCMNCRNVNDHFTMFGSRRMKSLLD